MKNVTLLILPLCMFALGAFAQDVTKTVIVKRIDDKGNITEEKMVSKTLKKDSLPSEIRKIVVRVDSVHSAGANVIISGENRKGMNEGEIEVIVIKDGKEEMIHIHGDEISPGNMKNIRIEKRILGDSVIVKIDSLILEDMSGANPNVHWRDRRGGGQNRILIERDEFSASHLQNKATLGVMIEDTDNGVIITEIAPGSAAEKAGIRRGDVILKVNKQYIFTINGLLKALHPFNPGEKVSVNCLRNGKEIKMKAILQERN